MLTHGASLVLLALGGCPSVPRSVAGTAEAVQGIWVGSFSSKKFCFTTACAWTPHDRSTA